MVLPRVRCVLSSPLGAVRVSVRQRKHDCAHVSSFVLHSPESNTERLRHITGPGVAALIVALPFGHVVGRALSRPRIGLGPALFGSAQKDPFCLVSFLYSRMSRYFFCFPAERTSYAALQVDKRDLQLRDKAKPSRDPEPREAALR